MPKDLLPYITSKETSDDDQPDQQENKDSTAAPKGKAESVSTLPLDTAAAAPYVATTMPLNLNLPQLSALPSYIDPDAALVSNALTTRAYLKNKMLAPTLTTPTAPAMPTPASALSAGSSSPSTGLLSLPTGVDAAAKKDNSDDSDDGDDDE